MYILYSFISLRLPPFYLQRLWAYLPISLKFSLIVDWAFFIFARVFIHSEENKLWVSIAKSVIDLTSFVITSSSLANVTSVEIVLTERRTKSLNKEHMPCVQYPDEKAYNDCVRTLFASTLKSSINCTLPGNSFPNVIEYSKHSLYGQCVLHGGSTYYNLTILST